MSSINLHFISLHCKTTNMMLMGPAVCLLTLKLLLVVTAPTHGGMARLI